MGERFDDSPAKQAAENSVDWLEHNVVNPALNAGPLGIYNTVADLTHLPNYHLKVDAVEPYSQEWLAQSVSGGVGAALPYLLAGAAAGKLMGAADTALAGTSIGESLTPLLTSSRAATIAGAMSYSALQKPDETHTRFGNALGTAVGFALFDRGNVMAKDLSFAGKAFMYPTAGFVGGAAMTEASQLFSNGRTASFDQIVQGGAQGAALNSIMPLAQEAWRAKSEAAKPSETQPQAAPYRDISNLAQAYSDWVRDNKPAYPQPDQYAQLSPEDHVNLGFYHPEATNLDVLPFFKEHGQRPLPPADQVATQVTKALGDMPLAKSDGALAVGEWNLEFLTKDKANYFKSTYQQVVPRHHLMFVEEANHDGLAQIAQDNGYDFRITRENSRGQAVGMLIHPRLRVLNTTVYEDVANVFNIPDERPALRVDLQDTTTGQKFSAVGVHFKSMMGGPEKTAPVRSEQSRLLANDLGKDFSGIVAGDWNTFLEKTHDLDPLKNAGFDILNPTDATSTQAMGGRLDGFMHKNLNGSFANSQVHPFFKDPLITRGLSDHGLLTTYLTLNAPPKLPTFAWLPNQDRSGIFR